MRRPVRIASRPFLRFIPRERPVGPVAQWLEPAAHNGLVGGSKSLRPTKSSQGLTMCFCRSAPDRPTISPTITRPGPRQATLAARRLTPDGC